MNKFDYAAVAIAATGFIFIAGDYWAQRLTQPAPQPEPQVTTSVVVGFGCDTPTSVAVAYEEDALPKCAEIERHWIGG